MRKTFKRILTTLLCINLAGLTACELTPSLEGTNTPLNAEVKVARSSDKILQSYEKTDEAFKERFMGALTEDFSFSAYKNEFEFKQIIITPDKDVSDYTIEVSDFVNGENKISKEAFEVKHEYYHSIETIFDAESTMLPGYYPDALIPMENAKEYGLTAIKAGNNQGAYVSVKIPKDIPAATYTGTIKVYLEDKLVKTVAGSINVMDYTLPDEVSFQMLMGTDSWYLTYGELDNTQEMFDKYVGALQSYRISNGNLSALPYSTTNSEYVINTYITKALEKINDPTYSTISIPSPSKSHKEYGIILYEDEFKKLLAAYIDASLENEVNLFEKVVVSMGNIIDEAELGGIMDRAYYVAEQYERCLEWAANYADSKGASDEMVQMILDIPHVYVSPYSVVGEKMLEISDNTVYCPMANEFSTAAQIQRYQELEKGFWWYTCTQPKIPYPTYHIDDNGVSARLIPWMSYDYGMQGYLTWDTCCNWDMTPNEAVYGLDCYTNVRRIGDCYGDGILFYPGKVFGVDGPVHALRLPMLRDGLEEYEALKDLDRKYAALSEEYGVEISADGVLNEIYSKLYHNVKVYCDSETLDNMHVLLGKLLVAADKGIAVSGFNYNANGTVTAKVYAPTGTKTVTLNGDKVNGVSKDGVYTANISGKFDKFELVVEGNEITVPVNGVKATVTFEPQNIQQTAVYLTNGEQSTNQPLGQEFEGKAKAMVCNLAEDENRIVINNGMLTIDKKTNSIILEIYSDKKMNVTLSLIGNNRKKQVDIYTLYEGWNVVRIDRIYDLELSGLKDIQYLDLTLDKQTASTFAIGNISVL